MTTQTEQTTNPDEYNGWINRETWAAALHLSNDEWLYKTTRRIVAVADRDVAEFYNDNEWPMPPVAETNLAAERVEQFVDEARQEVLDVGPGEPWARSMIADVGSFWRVDWHAVSDSFRDE